MSHIWRPNPNLAASIASRLTQKRTKSSGMKLTFNIDNHMCKRCELLQSADIWNEWSVHDWYLQQRECRNLSSLESARSAASGRVSVELTVVPSPSLRPPQTYQHPQQKREEHQRREDSINDYQLDRLCGRVHEVRSGPSRWLGRRYLIKGDPVRDPGNGRRHIRSLCLWILNGMSLNNELKLRWHSGIEERNRNAFRSLAAICWTSEELSCDDQVSTEISIKILDDLDAQWLDLTCSNNHSARSGAKIVVVHDMAHNAGPRTMHWNVTQPCGWATVPMGSSRPHSRGGPRLCTYYWEYSNVGYQSGSCLGCFVNATRNAEVR